MQFDCWGLFLEPFFFFFSVLFLFWQLIVLYVNLIRKNRERIAAGFLSMLNL